MAPEGEDGVHSPKEPDEDKEEIFPPQKLSVREKIRNMANTNSSTEYLHVVAHTHWDREWYTLSTL